MDGSTRLPAALARPRVVVVGSHRDGLRSTGDAFVAALSREAEVVHIDARHPFPHALAARSRTTAALHDGAELVHVLDVRFAPVVRRVAARFSVPITATVSSRDLTSRTPWAALARRALPAFDAVFTNDETALSMLRDTLPALESLLVRPAASVLTEPLEKHTRRVASALRGVRPGRLVLGLLWPENRNDLRWFRDVVLPHLDAKPVCLLLGVPSAREARLLTGAGGARSEFRLLRGPLDAGLINATARCVDAFVSPASLRHGHADAVTPLALALAVSGVPMVTDGQAEAAVLAHERNAFLVGRGDERDFAATLNRLLALPAIQRHFLGEEFARFTLEQWNWREVASFYAERFASLLGRPRIPAALRAA
jgi:glycosyltransferase involved in cell wall biosynthesis